MSNPYSWDEAKRRTNLEKHGLDFADADLVLTSAYRLDITSERSGELRIQSFAYVFKILAVISVVFAPGVESFRIISLRRANRSEREAYYEWLENYYDDS